MNFMFHTMFGAACNIQRVHYTSMNAMFSFTLMLCYLREVDIFVMYV